MSERLALVLGGQKSGKSSLAGAWAEAVSPVRVAITPARADEAEMAERIAVHRADRPQDWTTVETFALAQAVADTPPGAAVVLDALDSWLLEAMTVRDLWTDADVEPWGPAGRAAADAVLADAAALADAALARDGLTIVIAGQPGLGPVAMGAAARRYVDLHGRIVRAIGERADRAVLVVAGRPLTLPAPGLAGLGLGAAVG